MAEEDLIFGKNRHMFGGIEPSNMLTFSIISKTGSIKLLAVLPNDTIINDQVLCTVAGAVIRRRTDVCPVDEFDGDFVADIKASGAVTDSTANLSKTYYYAAFPYTTQGVYNRGKANRVKYTPTGAHYIYGYDLDTTNPDPDTRVSYPSDVDNELFKPAKMNFTGTTEEGTFSYGSWPSNPGEGFMPRPCMLNRNGTVKYYLDPNDYTMKLGGREASEYDIPETKSDGYFYDTNVDAMMEWPKIYTKRELVNGVYKFRCAPVKIDESWECWCNYNADNEEIDHFYTSIYKRGYVSGNNYATSEPDEKLRSIAKTSNTIGQFFSSGGHAASYFIDKLTGFDPPKERVDRNNGWDIEVLADHLLIQDLLVMMAKTTDLKAAYGDGWSETEEDPVPGGLETKGLFYGAPKYTSASTQTGRVKIFGMEDYWDSKFSRRIAGWINNRGTQKFKITTGTKDGTTVSRYNTTGDGYLPSLAVTYTGSGGYISKCSVLSYGRLPTGYSGANDTYECDYYSTDNQAVYFAIIGGNLNSSENRGPFSVTLNKEQNYTSNTIGVALSCKPRTSS